MAAHLSPPTQALLQVIDSIQPATTWHTVGQANTITFPPIEVDYNPLRLQAQPYTRMLSHPTNPTIKEFCSIRPPQLRTNARGDHAWAEWWRTFILVQCDLPLPTPPMVDHVADTPTSYLQHALLRGLDACITFVANIQQLDDIFSLASTQLKPTPDGTYIIPHQKRNSPTNNTHYIGGRRDTKKERKKPLAKRATFRTSDPTVDIKCYKRGGVSRWRYWHLGVRCMCGLGPLFSYHEARYLGLPEASYSLSPIGSYVRASYASSVSSFSPIILK